jgi:hypothetical protein
MFTNHRVDAPLRSALGLAFALSVGCGDEHGQENPNEEACEHLKEGPSAPVTAAAMAGASAPRIANDHQRYDITLPPAAGSFSGFVSFAAAAAGDYIFYTNAGVPLKVTSSANADVAAESTASTITECTEVKGRTVYPLQVGTYTIGLGPASSDKVSVVVEADHGH